MKSRSEIQAATLQRSDTMIKNIILVLSFSVLTAVSAWIEFRLPFTPVPVTLQTFVVLLSGAFIGWKKGAISQLMYLAYGCAGLPVFSGGALGVAYLFGPTGGYLLAFPVAALISGMLTGNQSGFVRNTSGFLAASAVILMMGTAQLTLFTGQNWSTAFMLGTVPFIAGDLIKSVFASVTLSAWTRIKK